MIRTLVLSVTMCVGVMVWGCDRAEETTPAPAPAQSAKPVDTSTPAGKARALLDQLADQIQQQNWSEAEKIIKQLDALKNSVRQEMQIEIDNAQSTYKASKAIAEQAAPGQQR